MFRMRDYLEDGLEEYKNLRYGSALHIFKKAEQFADDFPEIYEMIASCYFRLGLWEDVITYQEKSLELRNDSYQAYYTLGDAYFEMGDLEKMKFYHEKAVKFALQELKFGDSPDPISAIYNALGWSYARLGRFPESIKYNELAIQHDTGETFHQYHNLGFTYKLMKDYKNAIKYFGKALEGNPKHADSLFDLGEIFYEMGDHEKGLKLIEKAAESDPNWYKPHKWLKELNPDSKAIIKEESSSVLSEDFNYIRDDVFLTAWLHKDSLKQKVIIKKINLTTGKIEKQESFECIHVAICDMNYEKLENMEDQGILDKEILNIRSNENVHKIHLEAEEKFLALKSWVAGIAEAGLDSFRIQEEVETAANIIYPIYFRLIRFMAMVEPRFLEDYISRIEKECMFEGKRHNNSLIANLAPLLNFYIRNKIEIQEREHLKQVYNKYKYHTDVRNPWSDFGKVDNDIELERVKRAEHQINEIFGTHSISELKEFDIVLKMILEIDPPLELFEHRNEFMQLLADPIVADYPLLEKALKSENRIVKLYALHNKKAPFVEKFKDLMDPDIENDPQIVYNAVMMWNQIRPDEEIDYYSRLKIPIMEIEAIKTLEKLIGQELSVVEEIRIREIDESGLPYTEYRTGIVIKNGHVVELGLDHKIRVPKDNGIFGMSAEDHKFFQKPFHNVPECIFNFTQLEKLFMTGNEFTSLPKEFSTLSNLKEIDLTYNKFSEFPSVLTKISSLESLTFIFNGLKNIQVDLSNLKKLRELNLAANEFSSLPDSVTELTSLEQLEVTNCKLVRFPDNIGNLVKLKVLRIAENQIQKLPQSISNLENLVVLDASSNKLNEFKIMHNSLSKLRALNLRGNGMKTVDDSIYDLHELEDLDVSANRLKFISDKIGNLTNLKKLDVSQNMMMDGILPDSICNLRKMVILDVSISNCRKLPEQIGDLKDLKKLNLRGSSIDKFPDSTGNLKSLISLDISGSPIGSIPASFKNFTELEELYMTACGLKEVPEFIGDFVELRDIDFSQNQIRKIPQSFNNLKKIKYINFDKNPIEEFPDNLWSNIELSGADAYIPTSDGKVTYQKGMRIPNIDRLLKKNKDPEDSDYE